MAEKEQITESGEINSSNIFEEFENDVELKKEIHSTDEAGKKDLRFYLSKSGMILQIVFFVLFFFALVSYIYIYVQKNENLVNSSQLDPFCALFLGDTPNTDMYCSSVFGLLSKYTDEYKQTKVEQAEKIISIIDSVYKIENFTKSKDVVFLTTKTQNRVLPLRILEKFDDIKRDYEPLEKEKIQCYDIKIKNDNILSLKCMAYSAGYEKGIKGFEGNEINKVEGTSISIATSFLNFIEKNSKDFTIINKQKVFTAQKVIGETTGFTNKTLFNLELQYNPNNLSL